LPKYSMVAALMVAASVLMVPASLLIDQPWGLSVVELRERLCL